MPSTPHANGGAIPGLTDEVFELLFEGAPAELSSDPIAWWADGPVIQLPQGHSELVGFAFGPERYIAIFTEPLAGANGDQDFLDLVAINVADGYPIEPKAARLVKFCRADAEDKALLFAPDAWQLPRPKDVFEFTHVLAEVMARHYLDVAPRQYFYQPSTQALEILYRRVFRVVNGDLLQGTFQRIKDPTGTYVGYETVPHH